MEVTCETMAARWQSAERPPFKGKLIDHDGCCCAQGDTLRCAGYTDEKLRAIDQSVADRAVAKLLGISVAHSVLLRQINDKADGCPQDVLTNPEKILGPEAKRVLAFWKHLDAMPTAARAAAGDAAGDAARAAAGDAARAAAWDAARAAAGDAAGDAARAAARAAAWAAARAAAWAANEIQGHSLLKSLYFLPMFGINKIEDLD